jgi:RNA polymerase sigma factor (sigma-70 family)
MGSGPLGTVLRELRCAVWSHGAAELSDVQLLQCFVNDREDAAFAALVKRHGPLVWGVCRRILQHAQDGEDAFQATFFVLARKAGSLSRPEMLSSWLYGVAYRIALRARAMSAKRVAREKMLASRPMPETPAEADWKELEPLLDRELSRLPGKYQAAIVMCDVEGRSRRDAARDLGLNEGTLSSRLARGREILRKRLERHRVSLTCGGLMLALSQHAAGASVPPSLLATTIQSATLFAAGQTAVAGMSANAVFLAHGALKAIVLTKIKIVLVLAVALGLGGGWAASRHTMNEEAAPLETVQVAEAPQPKIVVPAPAPDLSPTPVPNERARARFAQGDDWDDPDEEPPPIAAPPAELNVDPFYKKYLSAGGLPILSSERVSDAALHEAAYLINSVLEGRDDLRQALIASNVRFLITHPTEKTTDLPERRALKPKLFWDSFRGVGESVLSCSEENLLHKPEDPNHYVGKSILIGAIARSVHTQALRQVDPRFERRLQKAFERAMAKGLWKGTTAAIGPKNYWEEAVQAYFDANNIQVFTVRRPLRVGTRERLARYDPAVFALVADVFQGTSWRYRAPDSRARAE